MFRDRILGIIEEIATTSGSTAAPKGDAPAKNHSGSPSNVEQMLKNDTASPIDSIKEKTTPSLGGPETQREGDKSSGFADFNFRPPSDTPKQTPNDVLSDSNFLHRMINHG